MIKLAFVFQSAPQGSAHIREGIEALLSASAFCDENELAVYFINDGVLNLITKQQAGIILQKNCADMLKLLDLYEIKNRYICFDSLQAFHLKKEQLLLEGEILSQSTILQQLRYAKKLLNF